MITNFNEQLAIDFDIEIAVFLENLIYWLKFNSSKDDINQRNFYDGRYWSYNSYTELSKLFPIWSPKTMRTIIARCVKHDLIAIGNFNHKKYDNTNWYTLSDKALTYFPYVAAKLYPASSSEVSAAGPELYTPAQTGRTPAQTGRPIPTLPTIKENNTTNSEFANSPAAATKPKKQPSVELRELIEVYRQEFPNNPQPHPKVISTTLQKTLSSLVKRWPELAPDGKPLSADTFRRYLIALKGGAPKFALGEYVTQSGNRKKNNLETFARWNTVVKFLENQYS